MASGVSRFSELLTFGRVSAGGAGAVVGLLRTRLGRPRGIAFIDSLPLPVCHNRRIDSHQVFASMAQRGKSSMGWFYGFKLHFVMNDEGDLLAVRFTPGNVDGRAPVPGWAEGLWGKLLGNRGYLGQELFERLEQTGVQLITELKRNMRNKLMPLWDKLPLRKRALLIESGGEQLKPVCPIAHTRHRSVYNAFVHALAALVAYTGQEHKPSLLLTPDEQRLLAEAL